MPTDVSQVKAGRLVNDLEDINFLQIIAIFAGVWLTIYFLRRVIPFLAKRAPSQFRLVLLGSVPVARLLLLFLAILWVIPMIFNITLQNFVIIAGAASVAIGFAFKDYVSSLIAGIVAIAEQPYRPGDWIEVDGDYGEVISVGMRTLRIKTPSDDVVAIPHGKIWSNNISNSNDGEHTLMCVADFYVDPQHDAAALRALLLDVGLTSVYLDYQKPVLVVLSETPWGTHYKLKAYPFDMRDQFSFISELTINGKKGIAALGASEVCAPVCLPGPPATQQSLSRH